MPKDIDAQNRRIMISIRQKWITEAGKNDCDDIESYIQYLKNRGDKLEFTLKILTTELQNANLKIESASKENPPPPPKEKEE